MTNSVLGGHMYLTIYKEWGQHPRRVMLGDEDITDRFVMAEVGGDPPYRGQVTMLIGEGLETTTVEVDGVLVGDPNDVR